MDFKVVKPLFFSFVLIFVVLFTGCEPDSPPPPQNIILLIGDGMSYPQIAATEYVHGPLTMTYMPVHGMISTYANDRWVTDSASSATALAAGYKTDNGMLGMLPDGTPVQSIAHYASDLGKRTGLVASCRITHATPAGFAIHHERRSDYFIIAEKFVESGIDLLLGAGWNDFLPENEGGARLDDRNLIREMEGLGYVYIDDENELETIVNEEKAIAFLEEQDLSRAPERGDQLIKLTETAISNLSQHSEGFFLMIEGSQIDWAGHGNDLEWMIEEMQDFDAVVGAVLEFAEQDGNTLVVVTADHETGGLSLPSAGEDGFQYEFSTDGHTGLHVPVFAYGPMADIFSGRYDNTDVASKLFSIWGKEFEE